MQAARTYRRRTAHAAAIVASCFSGCGSPTLSPADVSEPEPPATSKVVEAANKEPSPDTSDDGKRLWASPTAGRPIALAGVQDGAQLILHARPAALLSTEEGRRAWRALGSLSKQTEEAFIASGASDPVKVDQFTLSLAPGESHGAIDSSLAIDATQREEAPLLSREFETLLDSSDAEHHATLIVSPEFLLGSGGVIVGDADSPLRHFLLDLCEEDWRAVALAIHLSEERLYWEARVLGDSTTPELRRARSLVERLGETPGEAEELVRTKDWSAYAKPVIAKTPAMLEAFSQYSRRGVEGRQAVINGYLPAKASHNLTLAAELLMVELSSTASPSARQAIAAVPLADRLQQPVTAVFERESLESAVAVLANTLGVPIEIAGRDLQLEGITRNQMLSLDLRETPAESVLVELLRKANPDTLATGPADPLQKLVYTVRGDRIVITTRAAAERRGEALPETFLP